MFKDPAFWFCMAIGAIPGGIEVAQGYAAYPAAAIIDGAIITVLDGGILYLLAVLVRRWTTKSKQETAVTAPPAAPSPESPEQASP